MFSSESFIVSALTFRSLINFYFILVYDIRKFSSFTVLHMVDQFSNFMMKRKKRCPFHHRGLVYKRIKSRDPWSNRQVWPWSTE